MCDYSLENYVSRPAKVGENLRTYTFPSRSAGMVGTCEGPSSSPSLLAQAMRMLKHTGGDWDFGCAVCLQPGTELIFSKPIRLASELAPRLKHAAAKFVQLPVAEDWTGPGTLYSHNGNKSHERDAIELPDGSRYLFRELASAQVCTVVQLPRSEPIDEQDHKPARLGDALTERVAIDDLEIAR